MARLHEPAELVYFPTWTAGRRGYAERVRELFDAHLQKRGLRMTHQKQAILDALLRTDRHLSLQDLHKQLRGNGIGKVTIFRMLKVLEECGLVDRVTDSGGLPRFELKGERPHHDHLICVECGGITEVRWPEVERIQEKTCRQLGFGILYHRHELFGRCKRCRSAGGTAPRRSP